MMDLVLKIIIIWEDLVDLVVEIRVINQDILDNLQLPEGMGIISNNSIKISQMIMPTIYLNNFLVLVVIKMIFPNFLVVCHRRRRINKVERREQIHSALCLEDRICLMERGIVANLLVRMPLNSFNLVEIMDFNKIVNSKRNQVGANLQVHLGPNLQVHLVVGPKQIQLQQNLKVILIVSWQQKKLPLVIK